MYLCTRVICPYCGKDHIDEDVPFFYTDSDGQKTVKNFGREPHGSHLCAFCGKIFPDPYGKSIGGVVSPFSAHSIISATNSLLPPQDGQITFSFSETFG